METCLLCGTKGVPLYQEMHDRLFDAPGVWSHLRCLRDGHVWLSSRPTINDIGKVYTTYYTHNSTNTQRSILVSLKSNVERILLEEKFGYEKSAGSQDWQVLRRLIALLPMAEEIAGSRVMWLHSRPNGKLLDVGCGNGSFLATMQKLGWDVAGIEPDANSAKLAQERLGTSVRIGTIEEADFPADSFDAVTAHHVIEHMHHPIEFLRECFRILKPKGKLVVTTPNIASLGHRVFHKSWRGLEPPRHFHLFSSWTLGACAEQAGYRIDTLRTTARSTWEIWYASRLIHRDGCIPGGFPKRLSPALLLEAMALQLLENMMINLRKDTGEAIVLIASKSLKE